MRFINSEDKDFLFYWEQFLEKEKASFYYTKSMGDYYKLYIGETLVKDLSFVVVNGKEALAICPLFCEDRKSYKSFSIGGSFMPTWLIAKDMSAQAYNKAEKAIVKYIDKLAAEYGVAKYSAFIDPVYGLEYKSINSLQKFSFLNSSILTQFIDLEQDLEELWKNLSKGHRCEIKASRELLDVQVMDYTNADKKIFDAYRELHALCAGRVTRSKESFDMNFDMIKKDQAILVYSEHKNEYTNFTFFTHKNGHIYYFSTSKNINLSPEFTRGHNHIWTAIEYYKERQFKFLETGHQLYSMQHLVPVSKKEIAISVYKRGFGGFAVALNRGIKYYDSSLARLEIENSYKTLLEDFSNKENL